MRYTIAAMLIGAGCTGSPNYHRTYAPATSHASSSSTAEDITSAAVEAITDAGFTVETSTAGVVISKWEPGRGFTGDQSRYRLRVTAKSGGRFTVSVLCQSKAGGDEWSDCDELRPQWALDVQAKVTAQIEAAVE